MSLKKIEKTSTLKLFSYLFIMKYTLLKINTPFVPYNFTSALRRFFKLHSEDTIFSMEITGKKQITILPKCKIDSSNKKHTLYLLNQVVNKVYESSPLDNCFLQIVIHNPGEIAPSFKDVL